MNKQELKYYFMTPVLMLLIFSLAFIQILIFSVQKEKQHDLQETEKSSRQQTAALAEKVALTSKERAREWPAEAFSDFIPEGMEIDQYLNLYQAFWQKNVNLALENYHFLNQNINSRESLRADLSQSLLNWQTWTQFNRAFAQATWTSDLLISPSDYFSPATWQDIKNEFALSDYEGIYISNFMPLDAQQELMITGLQYQALYKLRLYEENYLPFSQYSSNGFIRTIFQRDRLYNSICVLVSLSVCLIVLANLEQNHLKKLYHLSLGRRGFYQHRFRLLFGLSFLPMFSTELLVMVLRNYFEPGVSLSYPITIYKLTGKVNYAYLPKTVELKFGAFPIRICELADFNNLSVYPLYLILLMNLAYLLIMLVFLAALSNFLYSLMISKNFKCILAGLCLLFAPLMLLFYLYPLDQLGNLFDVPKLLQGLGPWPYVYSLLGFSFYSLLLYVFGLYSYSKSKVIG